MLERVRCLDCRRRPLQHRNLEACEEKGLEAYISTGRQQHGQRPRPARGRAPRYLNARGRMDRKLGSKIDQAIYGL